MVEYMPYETIKEIDSNAQNKDYLHHRPCQRE